MKINFKYVKQTDSFNMLLFSLLIHVKSVVSRLGSSIPLHQTLKALKPQPKSPSTTARVPWSLNPNNESSENPKKNPLFPNTRNRFSRLLLRTTTAAPR